MDGTPDTATVPRPATLRGRALLRALTTALAAVLLIPLALMALAWWSVSTAAGSASLLALLPGVQVEASGGKLVGDFDARSVRVELPRNTGTLVLDDVAWHGLRVELAPAPQWLRISIDALTVRRAELTLAPATGPVQAPPDLLLPVELDLRSLRIGEFHSSAIGPEPLRAIEAHIHVGANGGAEHRIDDLSLSRDRLAMRGRLRAGSAAPMPLDAYLAVTQQAGGARLDWSALATLSGPLAAPSFQATLRAVPQGGHAAQTLDAQAILHPFAPWPLAQVQASAVALDLAAFSSGAPSTALTSRVRISSVAMDQPAQVAVDVTNALAGRWDEGKLPLRSLALEIAARPDQATVLDIRTLALELGTPQLPAGRLQGRGRWTPDSWNLAMTLRALHPNVLDARVPSVELNGPVALAGRSSALDTVDVKADLTGVLPRQHGPTGAQFQFDATLNPSRIEIRDLHARAGGGSVSLSGLVSMPPSGQPWTVKAQAAVDNVDPAVWWPGRDDVPWRMLKHRFTGNARFDLQVPGAVISHPSIHALAALRGDAALKLEPSLLAGAPVAGEATLHGREGLPTTAVVTLNVDGNQFGAEGHVATHGGGSDDVWDLSIDSPALARLAPVVRLFDAKAADLPLAGVVTGKARISGRWPATAAQGQFDASALRIGTLNVQQAQAHWSVGTSPDAPVEARINLTHASLARPEGQGPSVEAIQLQLHGTNRAHALTLRAESNARPPAWIESLQPTGKLPAGNARSVAVLQAQGGFIDVPGVPPGSVPASWRGSIQDLQLTSASAESMLRMRDVGVEAIWGGGPWRVALAPGRAELGAASVRWNHMAWNGPQQPGASAHIELDAQLEHLRVAELLARAQPGFGWGGDLSVAGHLKLHTTPGPASAFSADVMIERSAGDLTVSDEAGTRALGLTDLRFALVAEQGIWKLTHSLAARSVGSLGGAIIARTTPDAVWPTSHATVEGAIELQVADIGAWGNWLPAGWRLNGALRANAKVAGQVGAPEFTGAIEASQLTARNFVQGINVTEGDVSIRLLGSSAHIERFSAMSGKGRITLTGDASLGAAPKALLTLTADHFQLLGRVDRHLAASGSGRLKVDLDSLALDGRFGVDEGLIDFSHGDSPSLPADVEVVRARPIPAASGTAASAGAPSGQPVIRAPGRAIALDLNLALGDKLRVRGNGLDAGLRGNLRMTSPGGQLAVAGTVSAADGTFAAYGQKLTIDRGQLIFNGPVGNPRLDIEATRPNTDIRVGVAISGSAVQPHVRLFSEPEMSQTDKLSWLVLGRAPDGLDGTDTALLQAAALALVTGNAEGPGSQAKRSIGLDDISLRQQANGDVHQTVVALGKQLSQHWYVGYERGLNATNGAFQLIYRLSKRLTVRAKSGEDNAVDLIWNWRWQ